MDMARRINEEELAMPVSFQAIESLVGLHPSLPALTEGGVAGEEEVEEEEEEDVPTEGEVEEKTTSFSQESEAPLQKKAMRTATPHSKLVPTLTIADARDVYSRDATAIFWEQRKLKGKKLYGDLSPKVPHPSILS